MGARNGKREHGRRFTGEEKLRILEEARQPGTTVAEVLRRYQLDGTTETAGASATVRNVGSIRRHAVPKASTFGIRNCVRH